MFCLPVGDKIYFWSTQLYQVVDSVLHKMIPTNYHIIYLTIIVIGVQLILMTYGYLANRRAATNRIFVSFMLALTIAATGVFLLATAPTFVVAAVGAWLHALGIFLAAPFLALLLLALLAPNSRWRRWLTWMIGGVGALSVFLLAADLFVPGHLVFQFEAATYAGGYLSLHDYLTGAWGPLLYNLNVRFSHILFPILVLLFLLSGIIPPEGRRLAQRLLLLLVVSYVVNGLVWFLAPGLIGPTGFLSVSVIATWAIVRYRILSPVSVGGQQALNTAVFGIMVFDKTWQLLESNEAACRLLRFQRNAGAQTLLTILDAVAGTAVNQEGIRKFLQEITTPLSERRDLGLILSAETGMPTWLYLQFMPIYEQQTQLGVLCTVEDQTSMRQFQAELEAANQSVEQFAYRMTLLNDIIRTGVSGLSLNSKLQRFTDRLGDLFVAEGCYLTLWDQDENRPVPMAAYGPLHDSYPIIPVLPNRSTVTGAVLETGRPLVIQDIAASPYAHFYHYEGFRGASMLAVPLLSGGQKLGAILIIFEQSRKILQEDIALGEQAAGQVALTIAREQAFQAERDQRELAERLREIGNALTATLDYEQLLDMVLEQIQRIVPYDTANITVIENDTIRVVRFHGYETFTSLPPDHMSPGSFSAENTPTFHQMTVTRQPLCLSDVRQYGGWVTTEATQHIQSWIGVPLLIGGEVTAFLCVDKVEPGFYKEHHKKRLSALAYQVALALHQAHLFADSQRRAQQLSVLNDLATGMTGLMSVQELTDLAVKRLNEDFHYDNVDIFMRSLENEQELVLQSVAGIYAPLIHGREIRQPVGKGIIGQVVARGKPILENDTSRNVDFFQPAEFKIQAELAVPIKTGAAVLGVLNVDSEKPNAFDHTDQTLLTIVADQLAAAIQKARLFELTDRRVQELGILSAMSANLREAHTVQQMMPLVLKTIVKAIDALVGVIYLIDPASNQVVSEAVYPPEQYPLGLNHQLGQGITGHVAASGEMYISKDLNADPRLYRHAGEDKFLAPLQTGIALPLQTEGITIGVIHLGMAHEHQFLQPELQLLNSITDIAANALYRAQMRELLEKKVEERTRELQEAYIRLQELDRLKSKFISDVTHELRTPVANLSLYLDLMKLGKPERQQHYMQVIASQAVRLTELVETTMQVPDPDVVVQSTRFQLVALAGLVETAVRPFSTRAHAAGLAFTVAIEPDLPPAWGDAVQLAQVLNCLLTNAVNYTPQGQINVTVAANYAEKKLQLQVTDTGMGIDEEDMPYIFERFYRGRKVGQLTIPGIGLGLALAKEIIEQHNGRIHIHSLPNTGTTCIVWLPFAPDL